MMSRKDIIEYQQVVSDITRKVSDDDDYIFHNVVFDTWFMSPFILSRRFINKERLLPTF